MDINAFSIHQLEKNRSEISSHYYSCVDYAILIELEQLLQFYRYSYHPWCEPSVWRLALVAAVCVIHKNVLCI